MTYLPKHRKNKYRMPRVVIAENGASVGRTGILPNEFYFDGELFPYHVTDVTLEAGGFGDLASITITLPVDDLRIVRRGMA